MSAMTHSLAKKMRKPAAMRVLAYRWHNYVGSVLEGKLTVKGDVEIAGELKGDVVSAGKVVVRNHVEGNITTATMTMAQGAVIGGTVTMKGKK